MKIAIVVGTRPEIIKLSSIIHELNSRHISFILIHSNQHYSPEMDTIFFEQLQLPKPHYNLNVNGGTQANQVGNIMIKIEPILANEKPNIVIVQGDTNTVLGAAMAAQKLNIKVAHVEAGLRSYDRTMPEETNRVVTDHISDYLFAVTNLQYNTLVKEGISEDKIFTVGNTVADAVFKVTQDIQSDILKNLKINPKEFILTTMHRANTVDHDSSLRQLVDVFERIKKQYNDLKIVFPIHPRTEKSLDHFGLKLPDNVLKIDPIGYVDFVSLIKHAKLILTDSGGVQEEACILGTPCVTMRENTERPETIDVGANLLGGIHTESIMQAVSVMLNKPNNWISPFGDGKTAKRIVDTILPKSVKYNVTVVGLGYMGLPMACLLANAKNNVVGYDIDSKKVKKLQNKLLPFSENGLDAVFQEAIKNGINFIDKQQKSDIYIISVPTPVKDEKCDLSIVKSAFSSILEVCENGCLVILESTSKPGACDELVKMAEEKNKFLKIAYCPERAIPGQTLYELTNNDRVIGGMTVEATELAYNLYATFSKGKLYKTSARVAECVKLVENTYRDVNIALANELDFVLSTHGVKSSDVFALANKHPRVNVLDAGIGVGGHCIAVDPWFLIENGLKNTLIEKSRNINDNRPKYVANRLISVLGGSKKIAILGYAYKKNVDDYRETPVLPFIEELVEKGFEIKLHDPLIETEFKMKNHEFSEVMDWCDVCFIAVEHDVFKTYTFKRKVIGLKDLYSF